VSAQLSIPLSPELIAGQLELAATDVIVETQATAQDAPVAPETVAYLTDTILGGSPPYGLGVGAPALTIDAQVAILTDVRIKAADVWTDVRTWLTKVFRGATDKLQELAKKLIDVAQKIGVTVEHLILRLYRRVMRALVESSVLPPFTLAEAGQQVNFKPTEVEFSFTLKVAPSLGAMDVAGVVTLLSGLMDLEFEVETKYALA
jgi:hypothetical protein